MTMRSTFFISFVTYKNFMLLICHVLTMIYEITMPGTKPGKVSKLLICHVLTMIYEITIPGT